MKNSKENKASYLYYYNKLILQILMELVQIIYTILLYGGALLIFVVLVSFFLSRLKSEEGSDYNAQNYSLAPQTLAVRNKENDEQSFFRKDQTVAYPKIFQLSKINQRDIKIIRRSNVAKRKQQERARIEERHLTKTNGNGKRYTIVNDDMKKSRFRTANFYL